MQISVNDDQSSTPYAQSLQDAGRLFKQRDFTAVISKLTPIVRGMDTSNASATEIFALTMMADAQRFNGLCEDAYRNYVVASELDPNQAAQIEPHILHCLPQINTLYDNPGFETHLLAYLKAQGYQNQSIDRHASNILTQRFDLTNDAAEIDFSSIVTDQFLIRALGELVLADQYVEKFLSTLRGEIFKLAVENGIPSTLAPIVVALAEHAELIEYAFDISKDEHVLLLGIKTYINRHIDSGEHISELLEPLALYLMFEPVSTLAIPESIILEIIKTGPEPVQTLFDRIVADRHEEKLLEAEIETLSCVTAAVSTKVMKQYEQNPYPRWRDVFRAKTRLSYVNIYPGLAPNVRQPKKFNRQLKCLVAGCGTGQQPIWLAANTKNINIEALDLSKPSLAFAKRQAIKFDLADKIKFVHGDILELDSLATTFDVIECSGVLHHMLDPEAAYNSW